MDNMQNPQLPEDDLLPEAEMMDENPVDQGLIEEIMAEQMRSAEEMPIQDPLVPEILAPQPPVAEEDTALFAPPAQIPADEEPPVHELFTAPTLGDEITPDESAMAWHGMTHPDDYSPDEEPDRIEDSFREAEDFPELASASPAGEDKKSAKKRPVRKGRPKPKKGEGLFGIPQLLATCVWLGIILAIGVTLGRMIWICAADVLAFGSEDKPVTVTIYDADTMEDIINKLHEADLIEYPQLFQLYADLSGAEEDIVPGIYDLNTRFDYMALVKHMSPSSTREVVEGLLIPEGYTCRQIFALMEEYKICTAQDLAAYAASGELDEYWFLEGVARDSEYCLEGYLFPDTYDFYKNSSPREVLEKMLDNFNYRFTEEMRGQLDTLNTRISDMMRSDGRSEEYIANHQFTARDVIIVASLIEKETASPSESFTIASVIYNRLFRWGTTPAYLNIDASVIYALGGRTDLTAEDMRIDHPYNTYVNTGLTPGPISNPGLASLEAALSPVDTNYYYYVLNPETKVHQFSTTLEEHEQWREQFRGME